ncbi:MAG: hypothetical protein ACYS9Y_01525, partial [Planctomycetota bacterium]
MPKNMGRREFLKKSSILSASAGLGLNLEEKALLAKDTEKKGGRVFAYVPHFSNLYYYSDPTHNSFFGFYTFYYFVDSKHQLKRKVPTHYFDTQVKLVLQKLIFNSSFLFRKIVKKIVGVIFNLNRF